MKKSATRIICFLVLLTVMFGCWNAIFKVKYGDGIYGVTKFYELEDHTVDVLILGSSHAFEDFNTGTLWDEYGMAGYVLGGSVQPMWNTYYYLKEALKTQSPKLIVLEGYCTTFFSEYIDDSRIIKNNYGLRWSGDKIESLKASVPKERWGEFFLEYVQYHTRYKELENGDFQPNQGNPLYEDWKGFGCNMVTTPLEVIDVRGITEPAEMYEKTEKYYRMIMELADEEGIPMIVIISPYAGITEWEQSIYIRASEIAQEYSVPFLNCNLINHDIGVDFVSDVADPGHLNYKGNQKFSKYIGVHLKSNYEIPDRRGDNKYKTWQDNADFIRQMIYDQELIETTNAGLIAEKLSNPNYWVFVSVDGTCNTSDEKIRGLLNTVGIYEENANGIWFLEQGTSLWTAFLDDDELYKRTAPHDFHLQRSYDEETGIYTNAVIIDNTQYKKVTNGVNILVYDTMTEKIADNIGVNADDNYNIVR